MSNEIGRFDTLTQLAQGSFSTVYKALDRESRQTVALKVLHLDRIGDRARLIQQVFEEADQAKPLNSPNIAALYGVGDDGDLLLAESEYVQGNSIATMLRRGEAFSIWDLLDIARQVCHALDHAQVHRVTHRSFEPAKIMVQWDGVVKVLGFGSSSMGEHSAAASSAISDVLYYMAPEQVRGEACDHRAAIFSLGAVLYEMATDIRPFAGETPRQVGEAILGKLPVRPVEIHAKLHPRLSELIMRALAKSPDERFQSGEELIRGLEQCRAGENASVAGTPAPVAQRAPATAPEKSRARAAKASAGATSSSGAESITPPLAGVCDQGPAFAIDPLVAEPGDAARGVSKTFSDVTELPPLKEVSVSSPAPTAQEEELERVIPGAFSLLRGDYKEKQRAQGGKFATRALEELRRTPPKLYLYAMAVSAAIIVLVAGAIGLHNYLEDRVETGPKIAPRPTTIARSDSAPPEKAAQAAAPVAAAQAQTPAPPPAPTKVEDYKNQEEHVTRPSPGVEAHARKFRTRPSPASASAAQLAVDSKPEGAEILFDGTSLCQSPCKLTGIAPGPHTISASKSGFAAASRTVSLSAGAEGTISIELNQLMASLSVASTPAGAVILIDGKDTGKLTPSQFNFEAAGTHTVTLRRYDYLEESSSVRVEIGQTANVNPTLKHLGNTDEIRPASGRLKKVFDRSDTSGMGIVSIRTQPKGAQIMVNNRALDKTTPFDFYLNPGTYVIDITMSGHRDVHRVIMLQDGEKLVIQETLPAE